MDNETTKNFIETIIDEDNEKIHTANEYTPVSRRNRTAISTWAMRNRFA